MQKNKLFLMVAVIMAILTGCNDYDHRIADIEDRLDNIEGVSLTTIAQQISSINVSLDELNNVDQTLHSYIKDLEAQAADLQAQLDANTAADAATKAEIESKIADINAAIEALKAKDTELEASIATLKEYVDQNLTATTDWANATFCTLEQYAQVQTDLAAIRELIASTKTEITSQYTEAIEKAIATSEEGMKEWVNNVLAEGYYDIADIDAKLEALETKLNNADADLQKQLEAQQAALEQAKTDLTAAYEKAIADAINENHGVISSEIAKAVEEALAKVDTRLAVIDNTLAGLQSQIDALVSRMDSAENRLTTIEEQIKAINSSITDLETVDAQLKAYIEALQKEAEDLQKQIDDNAATDAETKAVLEAQIKTINEAIATLEAKDEELEKQITALKEYVTTELSTMIDWAEATFSTLEQYEATQETIATIQSTISQIQSDITALEASLSAKIEAAIATSEEGMKKWVNETIAEAYYNKSQVDAMIAALEAKLSSGDDDAADDLAKVKTELEEAMATMESELKSAITAAINENNGTINETINTKINEAVSELNAKLSALETKLQEQIDALKDRIQSIVFIPQYSDGKVLMDYTTKTTTLDFIIDPATQAQYLANNYSSIIKVYARYQTDPADRTAASTSNSTVELSITNAVATADGILTLTISDSATSLSEDYWQGKVEAVIYIKVNDGNTELTSEMIPMVAHNYVSSDNSISGYADEDAGTGYAY